MIFSSCAFPQAQGLAFYMQVHVFLSRCRSIDYNLSAIDFTYRATKTIISLKAYIPIIIFFSMFQKCCDVISIMTMFLLTDLDSCWRIFWGFYCAFRLEITSHTSPYSWYSGNGLLTNSLAFLAIKIILFLYIIIVVNVFELVCVQINIYYGGSIKYIPILTEDRIHWLGIFF